MPLNVETVITPVRNTLDEHSVASPAEVETEVDGWTQFAQGYQRENTVAAAWRGMERAGEIQAARRDTIQNYDFDPWEDIEGTAFEDYPEALIGVFSPEEKAIRLRHLEEDIERTEQAMTGTAGLAGMVFGGLTDPLLLLPLGGAAVKGMRSPSAARAGLATARAAFLGESMTEAALHLGDQTRTFGETATALTAATFLGGLLGSGVQGLRNVETQEALKQIKRDLAVAGASGEEVPEAVLSRLPHIDVAEVGERLTEDQMARLAPSFGFGTAAGKAKASPWLDIMVNSRSASARRAILRIANWPAAVTGIESGATAESHRQMRLIVMQALQEEGDEAFVRYRNRMAKVTKDVEGQVYRNRLRASRIAVKDKFAKGRPEYVMTEGEFYETLGRAMRRGDKDLAVEEISELAGKYRGVFDRFLDEGIAEGIFSKELKEFWEGPRIDPATGTPRRTATSYLSRRWNIDKIMADHRDFDEIVWRWIRSTMDDDEIAAIAKMHPDMDLEDALTKEARLAAVKTRQNIVGESDARLAHGTMHYGKDSPLKARRFLIPDEQIEDFLDNDARRIMEQYVNTLSSEIGWAKAFKDDPWDELMEGVRDEYDVLRDGAKNAKEKAALDSRFDKDVRVLNAMRDRHFGTYAAPSRDHQKLVTAGRVARTFNMAAQLGGMMVSAIPDLGSIVLRNGVLRTMRDGIVPLLSDWKGVKLAAREARLTGAAWELTMDSRLAALADVGDEFGRNAIERSARAMGRTFGVATLMSPWNAALKQFSSIVTQRRMIDTLLALDEGHRTWRFGVEDLRMSGIEPGSEMAGRIVAQLRRAGGIETSSQIKWANTIEWVDPEAIEAFRAAVRRSVDSTIITPGIADRPLWMSHELGKTVGQYKSFAFSATQRMLLTSLQRRDLAVMNGIALTWALGAFVELTKARIAGRDTDDYTPERLVTAGLDRSGLVGIMGDVVQLGQKANLIPNVWGGPLSSRYAARNITSSFLGPTLGLGETSFGLINAIAGGNFDESNLRDLRRIMPYNQIFYIRWLTDEMERQVADQLGLPTRKGLR